MTENFKSVIIFNPKFDSSQNVASELKTYRSIHVFKTASVEEVGQIMLMSVKTGILFDDINLALTQVFDVKEGGFHRKFYLNWDPNTSDDYNQKLKSRNILLVKMDDPSEIITNLELYMFGKINIMKRNEPWIEPKPMMIGKNVALFSCIENQNGWKLTISSHQQQEDIDSMLGLLWSDLVDDVVKGVRPAGSLLERKTSTQFREFIKFCGQGKSLTKILIVHILSEDPITLEKVRLFLDRN